MRPCQGNFVTRINGLAGRQDTGSLRTPGSARRIENQSRRMHVLHVQVDAQDLRSSCDVRHGACGTKRDHIAAQPEDFSVGPEPQQIPCARVAAGLPHGRAAVIVEDQAAAQDGGLAQCLLVSRRVMDGGFP